MFSKNFNKCRHCACVARQQSTCNAGSTKNVQSEKKLNLVFGDQLKNMSLSQWKLINQLKVYVSRPTQEKSLMVSAGKEWLGIVQKLQMLYSRAVVGGREDSSGPQGTKEMVKQTRAGAAPHESVPEKEQNHNVLDGLESRISTKPAEDLQANSPPPKWQPNKCVSKESIYSRTKHAISSVMTAQSEHSLLKRLEELSDHLVQYPEARSLAAREGVVRLLLHTRRTTNDASILAVVREVCTLLGHVDPLPGRGIRILSIDGGGIRGVIVIELLKKLEKLTGKCVHEMFDYICGVSTGAILLSVLVLQKKSLDEMSLLYKELSTKIFTQNALWGTSNLMWSHSYYNTEMWETLLREYIGDVALIRTARDHKCPKLSFVSAVVNQAQLSAFVFRNYSFLPKYRSRYAGSCKYQVWQAVRASAAAPSYFAEFQLDGLLHQDGGILVNNPCGVALHEATHLWPGSPIQCVVSFGTGRLESVPALSENSSVGMSSWRTKFMKILDSATDTEVVHTVMSDLLPNSVYYRFNPHLAEIVSMVETDPAKVRQLELEAAMYYRRNEETFEEAARALVSPPSLSQRAHNWLGDLRARLV